MLAASQTRDKDAADRFFSQDKLEVLEVKIELPDAR